MNPKFAWVTDPHLNQCEEGNQDAFFASIRATQANSLLVSGDFSEAPEFVEVLKKFALNLEITIYYILGNHDFYFSSIERVRSQARQLSTEHPSLVYLTGREPIELTSTLGLVGDDGWADGRIGDYERSLVMMYDYKLIEELAEMDRQQRLAVLKALGDQSAARVRDSLLAAVEQFEHVILLTHIPPFREACWHEGRISNDEWAPHFTCQAMGDMLLEVMRKQPNCQLTVLCGHTHSSGICQPLENITVYTGGAEYGSPRINAMLDQTGIIKDSFS